MINITDSNSSYDNFPPILLFIRKSNFRLNRLFRSTYQNPNLRLIGSSLKVFALMQNLPVHIPLFMTKQKVFPSSGKPNKTLRLIR